MKPKFAAKFPLIVAISLSCVPLAPAATLYWDGTDSTANADGGNGTWSTANAWDNAATGGANATFVNNDTVNFGGTAGIVTASAALTAAATTFSTGGYTLDLTNPAATAYTLGTLTGAPTINVTLTPPSSSAVTSNSFTAAFGAGTSFAGFTGILNIGTTSQAPVSGRAQINSTTGALPANATVNVRSNSTLYASTALTHLAPITLNGGDTGEANGQLRLDSGANWGGSVTLAGDIATINDPLVGTVTGTGTISGNIGETGSRALSKGGNGTLVLTGSNSFTGGTIVRAGTLELNYTTNNNPTNNKLSDSAAVTLVTNSTLRFVGNTAATTSETANGLALAGTGNTIALNTAAGQTLTVDLTGTGSGVFTGSAFGLYVTTSGTGTPQLKLPGTTPSSPLPGVIYNTSYAATDASNFVVPAGTLNNTANNLATWATGPTQYATTGAEFINQVGAGVVIDGITFSDAGARTVTVGTGNTLTLTRGVIVTSAVGNFQSTITGGSIQGPAGGALNITNFDTFNQLSIASTITNNGGSSLVKMGSGVLELTSANSYAGGTTIAGGYIKLGNIGALGSGPVALNVAGATVLYALNLTGSQNLTNDLVVANFPQGGGPGIYIPGGAADVMELSGVISGGGATTTLSCGGAATTNSGVKFIISGNNSYSGNFNFYDGGILLNHANGFGTATVGMLQAGDTALVFPSSMTVSNPINHNSGIKRIDTGAFDVVLSGLQTFTAPTTKTGSGKLTLTSTATNTSTGNLTVSAGTLALGTGVSLASPTLTMAGGAVLDTSAMVGGFSIATGKTLVAGDTNASADVVGDLSLASGTGVINPAGDTATGTLTVDGNLTLNGGTLRFSDFGDQIALTGASRTLTLNGINTVTGPGGYLAPGTYTLVRDYTTVAGTGTFAYNGSAVRGGMSSVDYGATATTLTVSNLAPLNLTWKGAAASTVWDVNTTANWTANATAENFYQLDNVTFADAPLNSTVTINGTVAPNSIAFTNSVTTAYTMRGGTNTPVISGTGAMTKTGAGVVTLWHPSNTYSGGTTISAGTLVLNNAATVNTGTYTPLGTGLITTAGGTLQINPANGGTNIFTFPNALRLNGGTLYHEDGNSVFNGLATVDAATTIKTAYDGKDITLAAGLAGSANLTVSCQSTAYGTGKVNLGADGTYSGSLTISNVSGANGTLQLNTANALQNANVIVNTTAANDAYTATPNPCGLVLGGTAGANVTIAGLSGTQSAAAIHNADDTNTRTFTVNQSTTTSFAGSIGGTRANTQRLNLVKSGAGSLTLAGANTYTGNTTVSAGTLVMRTRNIGTGDVTVADGATLGVSCTGVSLYIDDFNLGTSGANTLAITNFTPNGIPVIDALGVLTKNATTTISLSGTLVSGSTFPQIYPLIGYQTKTGAGNFTLAPLPRGVVGALEDDGSAINLKITGFENLVWKGTAGNTWDINTTGNWKLGATDPATYMNGDNVVFDGSAANNTVDLTATVAPTSLTFNFDAPKAYSVSGVGAISGATGLVKDGTGTLTLATANTYNGTTTVNAGTLVLGNNTALGSTTSGTTIADEATLDLNGHPTGLESYTLDGSLLNSSITSTFVSGTISLSGDAIVGGSGNISLTAPVIGGYSLEKVGPGTLTFQASLNSSISGILTVSQGMVILAGADYDSAIGNSAGIIVENSAVLRLNSTNKLYTGSTGVPVTVNAGGKVELNAYHNHFKILNLNGGEVSGIGSGMYNSEHSTFDSTVTVAGTAMSTISRTGSGVYLLNGCTFDVGDATTGTDLLVSAPLTGGVLTKNGDGTMELSAANTYTGNTTVNAGTLHLADTGRLTFVLGATSGTSNSLTGSGDISIDGDFIIVTTAAAALTSGTWVLENVPSHTGPYGADFAVYDADGTTQWTDAGNDQWTKSTADGKIWTFDETTGTLTLALTAYGTWASQITDPAQRGRDKDPDGDGLTNLQEFLFGKNPTVSDGTLVNTTVSGSDLVLRWLQRESGATYTLKDSSTLDAGSWNTSAITPQPDTQPGDPTDYDQWKAVIPQDSGKKFLRIEGVDNN